MAWPLQTASATPITHGQLPGVSARRRDLLAGRHRLRRRVQLARRRRGGAERDDQLPGRGDVRGGTGRGGPRGQAGTARGLLPDERGDGRRARRRQRPRRGPPSDGLSHHARHRAHRNREESPMRRMRSALSLITVALVLLALHAGAAHAQKKTLVVALNQDPDLLDPTLARTYVGRIVFSHICEKLYEIDEGLRISPQLAAALPVIARSEEHTSELQ